MDKTADNKIKKLKRELKRAQSHLEIFYELTKAMRKTLHLEEISYIILTGLTSHQSLRYNRAALFFVNNEKKQIEGFMGLGPMNGKEASEVWQHIEKEKKDLYTLIENYHLIKKNKKNQPSFMKFIQSLKFPVDPKSGLIFDSLEGEILWIKKGNKQLKDDPLVKKLDLDEFIIAPLKIKGEIAAILVVDNYITKKNITKEEFKMFEMFSEQAAGALENSYSFELTLTKAHTDSLTGLWNYGYFQYKLDEELAKAKSTNQNVSLLMIDIDDFKKYNDNFGHVQGDKALKKIGQIIKNSCRKIDIVCRYGGEEFSLILPSNNKKEAHLLAERIRKAIEKNKILNYKFTISIGAANFPKDHAQKQELIKKADDCLYEAKRKGKNCTITC
ncbi:MAG: sensor domain-containing diguanylate cyclase [Candidatus Omnitrophica bacterium]|nr:sensor domain-containing diguanylate cyclase [Candidatus Omnitrophota bacterium]MCF7894222.1 sensor domain-containing diguanylate cyclase [Candidatus Omnitrophota bacterium]